MAKIKSRKSILKRFKITGKKKLLRKPISQNHFNSKDRGTKTMAKRQLKAAAKVDEKVIRRQIPYHI
jgi:ribosomal protein L35